MSTAPIAGREHPQAPLGRPRLHLRETESTNDRARALAIAGAPHGTLVTASFQSAGRGRHGRRWSAPPGSSVLASLILRSPPPLLPLLAAVAVCDIAPQGALIKWPNDVVLRAEAPPGSSGERVRGATQSPRASPRLAKLAGILIEGRPQENWAVLGIGLNAALRLEELPVELRGTAASLELSPRELEPTLARLLAALAQRLPEPAIQTLRSWRARDALIGQEISWGAGGGEAPSGQGRAAGIDGAGRLVVELAGEGRVTLDAGEVHLLHEG